ncbi:MAG: hypothetical protein LBJ73_02235 [Rickettsiales bacterium]|jgi:hypothetical protein|nr:hypothetical protein [Rickettsiales bacterium]
MKSHWKILVVFALCGTAAFVITEVFHYDFQMSGVDTLSILAAMAICEFLGYFWKKDAGKTKQKKSV